MRRPTAVQFAVVPLRWRAHSDGDANLARLARQHLGLALAVMALLGAAARALHRRVLSLALAPLPPLLFAALEALDQPRVQYVFLRLPRVVLRLPPFPFDVVLHFVLEREKQVDGYLTVLLRRQGRACGSADLARLTVEHSVQRW